MLHQGPAVVIHTVAPVHQQLAQVTSRHVSQNLHHSACPILAEDLDILQRRCRQVTGARAGKQTEQRDLCTRAGTSQDVSVLPRHRVTLPVCSMAQLSHLSSSAPVPVPRMNSRYRPRSDEGAVIPRPSPLLDQPEGTVANLLTCSYHSGCFTPENAGTPGTLVGDLGSLAPGFGYVWGREAVRTVGVSQQVKDSPFLLLTLAFR